MKEPYGPEGRRTSTHHGPERGLRLSCRKNQEARVDGLNEGGRLTNGTLEFSKETNTLFI